MRKQRMYNINKFKNNMSFFDMLFFYLFFELKFYLYGPWRNSNCTFNYLVC
jgi:hypothetical protein